MNENRSKIQEKLLLDIQLYIRHLTVAIDNSKYNVIDGNGYDLGYATLVNIIDFLLATATRVTVDFNFELTEEYLLNSVDVFREQYSPQLVNEAIALVNHFTDRILLNNMQYYALYIDNISNGSATISGYSLERV